MTVHFRQREPLPFRKRRPFFPLGSLLFAGAMLIGLAILIAHSASQRFGPGEIIVSAFATGGNKHQTMKPNTSASNEPLSWLNRGDTSTKATCKYAYIAAARAQQHRPSHSREPTATSLNLRKRRQLQGHDGTGARALDRVLWETGGFSGGKRRYTGQSTF
jgi:hypothetical protein